MKNIFKFVTLLPLMFLASCQHYYTLKASLPDKYQAVLEHKYSSNQVETITTIKDTIYVGESSLPVTYYEQKVNTYGHTNTGEYLLLEKDVIELYTYNNEQDCWVYNPDISNLACDESFKECVLFVNGKKLYDKDGEIHVAKRESIIQVDKKKYNLTTYRKDRGRTLQGYTDWEYIELKEFKTVVTTSIPHIDKL